MTRYVRSTWLQIASGWALSTFTLASLAAVGWYGHDRHWTFGLAGHGQDHPDPHDSRDAHDATHSAAAAHPAGATATSGEIARLQDAKRRRRRAD